MTSALTLRTSRLVSILGLRHSVAAILLTLLGLWVSVADAAAQTRFNARRTVQQAKPGAPSSRVRSYRLDPEVQRRRRLGNNQVSSVIVTLVPGAELPP